MGLTKNSTGNKLLVDDLSAEGDSHNVIVGLIGNPNVGKSSVFNNITGLHQHLEIGLERLLKVVLEGMNMIL